VVPDGLVPEGVVPEGVVPLGVVPLGVVPLGEVPLGVVPLGEVPVGGFGLVVPGPVVGVVLPFGLALPGIAVFGGRMPGGWAGATPPG